MAYLHIENLYQNQDILMFKECYAMEKIHGTSAHIFYCRGTYIEATNLAFFAGGSSHETFIKLFDYDKLKAFFDSMGLEESITIYGESYGGKCQGMSATYGKDPKFVAFEVKIGHSWLSVTKAEIICKNAGLDFVHYVKIPCTLEAIDEQRDSPSVQALKNGMGDKRDKLGFSPPIREGIVLRPLEEFTKNNGERIISKHKRDEFRETATPRNITDKLVKRTEIKAIIDEWVTEERLSHILNRGEVEERIEDTGKVIALMIDDINREAKEEIEHSSDLNKAIGRETALMFKKRVVNNFRKE